MRRIIFSLSLISIGVQHLALAQFPNGDTTPEYDEVIDGVRRAGQSVNWRSGEASPTESKATWARRLWKYIQAPQNSSPETTDFNRSELYTRYQQAYKDGVGEGATNLTRPEKVLSFIVREAELVADNPSKPLVRRMLSVFELLRLNQKVSSELCAELVIEVSKSPGDQSFFRGYKIDLAPMTQVLLQASESLRTGTTEVFVRVAKHGTLGASVMQVVDHLEDVKFLKQDESRLVLNAVIDQLNQSNLEAIEAVVKYVSTKKRFLGTPRGLDVLQRMSQALVTGYSIRDPGVWMPDVSSILDEVLHMPEWQNHAGLRLLCGRDLNGACLLKLTNQGFFLTGERMPNDLLRRGSLPKTSRNGDCKGAAEAVLTKGIPNR